MKKIKLYLEQIENTIVMRVLEQEGITEDLSENVRLVAGPQLQNDCIFVRGYEIKSNHKTDYIQFDTNKQAEEYLQKVIGWLDEVFVKPVEPKRGDYVFVNDKRMPDEKRIFLAKMEGSSFPYICVLYEDQKRFLNGEPFNLSSWEHIEPITKSGYNPDTKIYEGELSWLRN